MLLRQALKEAGLDFELRWINDGVAAATILAEADIAADLIVVDVSLPGQNGWEVVEKVKSNPVLAQAQVVMLSGSDSALDVVRAQTMGKLFFKKPMLIDNYRAIAEAVVDAIQ